MKIGLPRALLYYRYGQLWETFFTELGCDVITSGDTCKQTLQVGAKSSLDECCLPLKVYMGHVNMLMGRCDYILVPRLAKTGRDDEFCVRFWGLPDLVQNTFRDAPLLSYSLCSARRGAEAAEFVKLGRTLKKGASPALRAYRAGREAQRLHDERLAEEQSSIMASPGPKILIAAQPYVIHDSYVGGMLRQIVARQGATPLFSDRCGRAQCHSLSKNISDSLYWTLNRELCGAIEMLKADVDGIILLTAFPCGADSLVNELIVRRVKNVPMIQILLDEHTAPAGLETRIESFMDILQLKGANAGGA